MPKGKILEILMIGRRDNNHVSNLGNSLNIIQRLSVARGRKKIRKIFTMLITKGLETRVLPNLLI